MTEPRDFCLWLAGFFDLREEVPGGPLPLTSRQTEKIRERLIAVVGVPAPEAVPVSPTPPGGVPRLFVHRP